MVSWHVEEVYNYYLYSLSLEFECFVCLNEGFLAMYCDFRFLSTVTFLGQLESQRSCRYYEYTDYCQLQLWQMKVFFFKEKKPLVWYATYNCKKVAWLGTGVGAYMLLIMELLLFL